MPSPVPLSRQSWRAAVMLYVATIAARVAPVKA